MATLQLICKLPLNAWIGQPRSSVAGDQVVPIRRRPVFKVVIEREPLDVLIIGAGVSGIDLAAYLRRKQPGKRFSILEARERMGGTWDLFKYPGIRSDSDLYIFGSTSCPGSRTKRWRTHGSSSSTFAKPWRSWIRGRSDFLPRIAHLPVACKAP